MNRYNFENKRGFVMLITVMIILAIILLVGLTLGSNSITEMQMSLSKANSSKAYYLANLCAEHALMNLKESSSYAGLEATSTALGDCEILAVEGSWTVKVVATSSDQIKKLQISVSQIDPEMVIDSWQEVADF